MVEQPLLLRCAFVLLFFLFIDIRQPSRSIRLTRVYKNQLSASSSELLHSSVSTSATVALRERFHVTCDYQLEETDVLYSLKWYLSDTQQVQVGRGGAHSQQGSVRGLPGWEMFSYIPSTYPEPEVIYAHPTAFEMVSIESWVGVGGTLFVQLRNATPTGSVTFTCEVVADKSFQTLMGSVELQVVFPTNWIPAPRLYGLARTSYEIGDILNLTCLYDENELIPWYIPAARRPRLLWWINGRQPAPPDEVITMGRDYGNGTDDDNDVGFEWASKSRLQVTLREYHFVEGRGLSIKCAVESKRVGGSAVLNETFQLTQSEESDTATQLGDHRGNLLTGPPPEPPKVDGLRPHYRLGDLVDLNCSTREPRVGLRFYINHARASSYEDVFLTEYPPSILALSNSINTGNGTTMALMSMRFLLQRMHLHPHRKSLIIGCKAWKKKTKGGKDESGSIVIKYRRAESKIRDLLEGLEVLLMRKPSDSNSSALSDSATPAHSAISTLRSTCHLLLIAFLAFLGNLSG